MRHSNLGRFACWAPLGPKKAFDSGARWEPQCNERHVNEPLEGITLRAWHFLVSAVLLLKWVLWNRYIITVYLLCTTREIHRKIFFALIISQAKNQFLPPKHTPIKKYPPLPPNFPPYRKLKDPCYLCQTIFPHVYPSFWGPGNPPTTNPIPKCVAHLCIPDSISPPPPHHHHPSSS